MVRTPRARATSTPKRRFTLIELMVAIALGTILTGSIVFIFIQASAIFTKVDATVQVYQYARHAFDQMERDLVNVDATRTMEFFNDQAPPAGTAGVVDGGEELPITGTANTLLAEGIQGDGIYNFGFTVRQPRNYFAWDDPRARLGVMAQAAMVSSGVSLGQARGLRRDSIYFKTVTLVGGERRSSLVEYALTDTRAERPKLVKRTWRSTGRDVSNPLQPRHQVAFEEQDLCRYAVESTFELFVQNKRGARPGDYYSTAQLLNPPSVNATTGERPFGPHKNWWGGGAGGAYKMHQCYYDETHDGAQEPDLGVFEQETPTGPILFRTQRHFDFPQLEPGDRVFLYDGGPGFKPRAYTIKAFLRAGSPPTEWVAGAPRSELRLQFEEPLDATLVGGHLEVRYAAAWVPAAVRVTLRIKDAKSLQRRSVSRVFKILTQ